MKSNKKDLLAKLHPQVVADLCYALSFFPLASLILLRESGSHLIRRRFEDGHKGCIFNLLSRVVSSDQRIRDKSSLTRYFTGGSAAVDPKYPEMACYQPTRWLVRLWDGQVATIRPADRYGDTRHLTVAELMAFLDAEIPRRIALNEAEARAVRKSAKGRVVKR